MKNSTTKLFVEELKEKQFGDIVSVDEYKTITMITYSFSYSTLKVRVSIYDNELSEVGISVFGSSDDELIRSSGRYFLDENTIKSILERVENVVNRVKYISSVSVRQRDLFHEVEVNDTYINRWGKVFLDSICDLVERYHLKTRGEYCVFERLDLSLCFTSRVGQTFNIFVENNVNKEKKTVYSGELSEKNYVNVLKVLRKTIVDFDEIAVDSTTVSEELSEVL